MLLTCKPTENENREKPPTLEEIKSWVQKNPAFALNRYHGLLTPDQKKHCVWKEPWTALRLIPESMSAVQILDLYEMNPNKVTKGMVGEQGAKIAKTLLTSGGLPKELHNLSIQRIAESL